MLRMIALLMALSPAMWLSTAFALGLGEIDVKSSLNQRFSARIPLTDLSTEEAETLLVDLASPEDFIRAGLDRSDYLNTLSFVVKMDDGAPHIVVSSRQIAREPYLGILLDVRSRAGRIQRQFTVLLDPPDYAQSKETPSATPVLVEPTTTVAPSAAKKAQKKSPDVTSTVAGQSPAHAETYGPVAVGETLWSVATRLRTNPNITMDQMQLALFKANPQAFENGNVGKLLKGATLKVPKETAIRSVGPNAAKSRLQELRAGGSEAESPSVSRQPEATKVPELTKPIEPTAPAPVVAPKPAVPPVTQAPAPAVSVKPTTPAKPAPVASTPAPAQLTPSNPAPAIPVAKPALAATAPAPVLPVTASAVAAVAPASTVASTEPDNVVGALPLIAETASSIVSDGASAVAAELTSSVQMQAVEPVKPYIPPPVPPAPEPTPLFDDLQGPLTLAGGIAVVAGLLGWVLFNRKKKAKPARVAPVVESRKPFNWQFWRKNVEPAVKGKPGKSAPAASAPPPAAAFDEQQFERDFEAMQRPSSPASGKIPSESQKVAPTLTDAEQLPNFDSTQMFDTPPSKPLPAVNSDAVDFDVAGKFEAETLKIDLSTDDPLAEADFHLAYGLYDEAALHLKQAAQKEPARLDIPTKLAEVYFRAGKAVDFQEVAEGLKSKLSQTEWAKIALMGKQLSPDSSLYQGIDTDALATDMDLAFDEPTQSVKSAKPASSPAPAAAESALDFELTNFDLPKIEASKPAVDSDNSLEFNLDDFNFSAPPLENQPKAQTSTSASTQVDAPLEFDLSAFDLGSAGAEAENKLPNSDDIKLDDFDLNMSEDSHAISTGDEASTKLDLARAYVDMGDNDMARSLLNEVLQQGGATQKTEAQTLLSRLA